MAEDHRPTRDHPRARTRAWNAERVAAVLVPRRDRLVDQLPRELAAARGLTRDQCELVIDEAIDFMVTEYAKPITDREFLERAFWATASFRVKRVHEGRGATVRAGWQRVDVDTVEIASPDHDPAAHAVRAVERGALLEFAATLTEQERAVFACKFADGPKEQGRVVVARRLAVPVAEVRRAERAITRKLNRFVAIVSAGSLCAHRSPAIEALVDGLADARQELVARVHLDHCATCRMAYAAQMRALRSGELQHRIAQLLPVPAVAENRRHRGGAWDAVTDWASRPFTADVTTTGTQIAAGGRGIGTVAAAKLAALCIGGVTVVGGGAYCVTTVLKDDPPREQRPRTAAPSAPPRKDARLPSAGPTLVAVRKAAARKQRQRRSTRTAFGNGGDPATRHEREAPISPPAQIAGTQPPEFGPGPAGPVTQAPAAAPSTGAPEFP